MERRQTVGSFFVGFCLTLCVIGLVAACVLIEGNMRETTYGAAASPYTYTVEAGRLCLRRTDTGEAVELLASEQQERLEAVASAPARMAVFILQQESVLLERAWDWVEELMVGDAGIGGRREV